MFWLKHMHLRMVQNFWRRRGTHLIKNQCLVKVAVNLRCYLPPLLMFGNFLNAKNSTWKILLKINTRLENLHTTSFWNFELSLSSQFSSLPSHSGLTQIPLYTFVLSVDKMHHQQLERICNQILLNNSWNLYDKIISISGDCKWKTLLTCFQQSKVIQIKFGQYKQICYISTEIELKTNKCTTAGKIWWRIFWFAIGVSLGAQTFLYHRDEISVPVKADHTQFVIIRCLSETSVFDFVIDFIIVVSYNGGGGKLTHS